MMRMLITVCVLCSVYVACPALCRGDVPVGEHLFTTDDGVRVSIMITAVKDGNEPRLKLAPAIHETRGGVDAGKKSPLQSYTFPGDKLSTLRVNDWMERGVICVWEVDVGSKCEYRWATWDRSGNHARGLIPATEEMASHRFKVLSVLSRHRPSDDGFEVILDGDLENRSKRTLWYLNACGSKSSDRIGQFYALRSSPIPNPSQDRQ